eukprot:CAMPEP_0174732522 /NCGR_PEP_ID=MMETSP1094-20130205/59562_1 /TAXON_ID=156173 /ORGANISM="Chrysochromulina brevifilum, Strain UTEX LB 985" /LENGTH=321 /DNA_ID=CAMNT_0015935049 /DNA_START=134 /DNA_END=1095 /DNA_ORIENTATION=+
MKRAERKPAETNRKPVTRALPPAQKHRDSSGAGVGARLLGASGNQEDSDGGEEEGEEESEESQMCWSALFSCFPLIWTIASEFASEALEAGIIQHIGLMLLPLFAGVKQLIATVTAEPIPDNAPPAPPSPPTQPDFFTATSATVFGFAEVHPIFFFCLDFGVAITIGTLFLFWKDIDDWIERVQTESRQAADREARKVVISKLTSKSPSRQPSQPETDNVRPETVEGANESFKVLQSKDMAEGHGEGSKHWAKVRAQGALDELKLISHMEEQGTIVEMEPIASEEIQSALELKRELRLVNDKVEELEIKTKVYKKATSTFA